MMLFLKKIIPNSFKVLVKEELRRILLQEKNSILEKENIQSQPSSYNEVDLTNLCAPSITSWHQPIIYEASVNLALRDLCQPGATVFDVGSNEGGLTLLMSRLVGPKGIVCAFEANPYILDLCTHNLLRNGCNNFFITHACIWKVSDEILSLYIPPNNWQAASLYLESDNIETQVRTIALDDYIYSTNLEPELIKMDIEGAEFDALEGAKEYIAQKQPHLILEQWTHDGRCLELLRSQGYIAIDLNNYNFIETINDYPKKSQIRNVLFIHQNRIEETPYSLDIRAEEIDYFGADKFTSSNQEFILQNCIKLNKSRYVLRIDFDAEREDNVMSLSVYVDNILTILHIANSSFIQKSYRDCTIDIKFPVDVKIEIKFLNDTSDPTFNLKGVSVSKVVNFQEKFKNYFV